MEKLPGDYIAGFVDGEGCFALKFRRDVRHERKNKPVYFYWSVEFAICLRVDDAEILERIQYTLDCGRISIAKRGLARYAVNRMTDLRGKVIPFFDRYILQAKKVHDFKLWKEAVEVIYRNHQEGINRTAGEKGFSKISWNQDDLRKLLEVHKKMGQYKSRMPGDWKWIEKALQPGPAVLSDTKQLMCDR